MFKNEKTIFWPVFFVKKKVFFFRKKTSLFFSGCNPNHGHSPSSALAGDPRSPGFARAAGSSRSPSDAHFAVASEGALVPRVRPSLSSSALATGSETGPVLVDGEGPSLDGG